MYKRQAEDSFTVSEFDITPYVKETGNRLCVEVHKRSTAAFLEDQDFFRFFGLFRDVNLYGLRIYMCLICGFVQSVHWTADRRRWK